MTGNRSTAGTAATRPQQSAPATERQTRVLSDGTRVEMPLHTHRAAMFTAFFTISAAAARSLLPSEDLRSVRPSPRRALLGVQVMDYREKSIAPYLEFVTSIPVHRSPADVPVLSALMMERAPGAGAYLTNIGVTTEESLRVGWELLGFPKFRCEVQLAESRAEKVGEITAEGRSILTLAARRAGSFRERRRSFYSYSLGPDDHLLHHVPYRYTATTGLSFGRRSARLHLGDHPVSHELRDLDISPVPLMSVDIPHFTLVSNLPVARVDVGDWHDPRLLYRELRERRAAERHAVSA